MPSNYPTVTVEQLNEKLADPDAKVTFGFTKGKSKTRHGGYISIRKGLLTTTYFVGRAIPDDEDIIEVVG
jgi:hypothetical protein